MRPELIEEAWQLVDRDGLAALIQHGHEPLFATISGSHLYGFASPDSDEQLTEQLSAQMKDAAQHRAAARR